MPELPEVETIKRELSSVVLGKKIIRIDIEDSFKKKIYPDVRSFKRLVGKKIKAIERRGKILIFSFDDDNYMIVHLKMTGQLIFKQKKGAFIYGGHPLNLMGGMPNKFTRVSINFSTGEQLFFNDMRKFGYLRILNHEDLVKQLFPYGVEPLTEEFNLHYFSDVVKRYPRRTLKAMLLDQKHIAGLGNIYVDESCYAAGIRPSRKLKSLTVAEKKKLVDSVKKILGKAVIHRGTTFSTFVGGKGEKGNFQRFLKVYGKSKGVCGRCRTPLRKSKIAGRTTVFCDECQR
jgi:formamidopyrimidine-DNA glycosylase